MKFLAIVLLATLSAIGYAVLHDELVVRLGVECAGGLHLPALAEGEPRPVALARGVIAVSWVGAMQGLLLALAARVGRRPKLGPGALVLPMVWTLVAWVVGGVAAGALGAWLAKQGFIELASEVGELVPESEHVDRLAEIWALGGSYLASAIAGWTGAASTWKRRGRARGGAR